MMKTLLRYFAIVAVLIALMGVTHLGMQAMGAGANGPTPTANGEFARPDGHDDHDGHGGRGGRDGGGGHLLGSLLIVGVVGTAVVQISQRTRQRRSLITA